MRTSLLTAAFAVTAAASSFGNTISDETLLRFAPMPKAPVIDGRIDYNEWKYASTTFGGISPKTKLMTRRQNDFRIGYDAKYIYFAISSEIPLPPQSLSPEDQVEFQLLPPGKKEPVVIKFDVTGKGKIPAGVKVRNTIGYVIMNAEQGKCWTTEIAVPYSALGVSEIKSGEKWGLQMIRHWSSQKESGFFHLPKKAGEMATFIPDFNAPTISFDGFGLLMYTATGNYNWTYRIENTLKQEFGVHSESYRSGVNAAATLDINNPDLFGKEEKVRIGYSQVVKPGKTGLFQLHMMAQFPGKPRLLYSFLKGYNNVVYYKRTMFWDVILSQRAAVYKDERGLPYLNAGYYPSFGEKLRVAASFNKKLPIVNVSITVRNSKGKVLHTFARSGFGRPLEDFEDQTILKNLPVDDYTVTMESMDMNGKTYTHVRTFSIAKFPWQGLNLGKERIIIPPFKPLKVDKKKQEVHALLTGYQIGGGVWNAIYAENENILAAPIQFVLNGKPVPAGKIKLISAEKDRVVYEATTSSGTVKFVLNQEYDYDGFCKLTTKVIPQGMVKVTSFQLLIPMKAEYAKYYAALGFGNRTRGQGKPDTTIPAAQGEIKLNVNQRKGFILNYFWFGTAYKGFSWIIDTQKGFALDKKKYPHRMERKGNTVVFTQDIVNMPTVWDKPWEFTFGFSPTPVKPINKNYRSLSTWMYDYKPAKGSDKANMSIQQLPLGEYYDIQATPPGGESYYLDIVKNRGRFIPPAERKKMADEYIAKHKDWILKNAPMADFSLIRKMFEDQRVWGDHYFLVYNDPAHYSYRWKEAEMYKAEWLPWDYPVDDALNEYVACKTPQYIDKMLYDMRRYARWGIEGMNFDCFPLGGGRNTVSCGAFREKPGPVPLIYNHNMLQIAPYGIVPCRNLFGWRELTKRTAHMLYTEGRLVHGVPWVELHSTDSAVPAVTAFCSTVITTECASLGSDFFDRFPESYLLSDLAGLQAGVMPRPIVSTRSSKLSRQEQVKSLISWSFASGLMTHCDQGVLRGQKDFQVMRDEIFSFGFGRPGNKTIAYYDKEPQPIKCKAPMVRTTQVIRPDGKTLLMVGNMGDKVTATFDLSGLNYKKYKITDVFTGKVLQKAEVELSRHGYALLKIEKL